jgi:hypothetical protein
MRSLLQLLGNNCYVLQLLLHLAELLLPWLLGVQLLLARPLALLLLMPLLVLLLLTARERSSLCFMLLRPPVPERETGSCLDPRFAGRGEKGPAPLALVKRVSWNPAEMGKP